VKGRGREEESGGEKEGGKRGKGRRQEGKCLRKGERVRCR